MANQRQTALRLCRLAPITIFKNGQVITFSVGFIMIDLFWSPKTHGSSILDHKASERDSIAPKTSWEWHFQKYSTVVM